MSLSQFCTYYTLLTVQRNWRLRKERGKTQFVQQLRMRIYACITSIRSWDSKWKLLLEKCLSTPKSYFNNSSYWRSIIIIIISILLFRNFRLVSACLLQLAWFPAWFLFLFYSVAAQFGFESPFYFHTGTVLLSKKLRTTKRVGVKLAFLQCFIDGHLWNMIRLLMETRLVQQK